MNVFETHRQIVGDYAQYIRSFINISDSEIAKKVEVSLGEGRLWPQPLLQFNPAYEHVGTVEDIATSGLLSDEINHIFKGYSLYRHQRDAIELGVSGTDFVVTSGTGSGKSLTYIGTIFQSSPGRYSCRWCSRSHRLSDECTHQFANQRIQRISRKLRKEYA